METEDKTIQPVNLLLPEWTIASPQTHPTLDKFSFEDDLSARQTAQQLTKSGQIILNEFSNGLEIRTTSVVGSIQLGRLSITITPKIEDLPLMRLLRFAYGLRDLELFNLSSFASKQHAFQDLLILQLITEIEELIARGLLRRYTEKSERISSPTGRIDFSQFNRQGGLIHGSLPCLYYRRLENCLHNRVLLSGLLLAANLTTDLSLRGRTRRLANLLREDVQPVELNTNVLAQVSRQSNRLTEAYIPAVKVVALLMGKSGSSLDEKNRNLPLTGFLFDMNHFFQALLSRLLNEYNEGFDVEDEHALKGFLAYVPGYELPGKQDPMPRPDFAVFQKGKLISLLDAKYRDLWKEGLPRDMLYQLIVYALSQQNNRTATILYPSLDGIAKEAKIQINEPMLGVANGFVILRPVQLRKLEEFICEKNRNGLNIFAHQLVFG